MNSYNKIDNMVIYIRSGDNVTHFTLSRDIIRNIKYFNFIDELKYTDNTVSIELDYDTYLATILDISKLLNIKSKNYLSIVREPLHYIKEQNIDMINYYLHRDETNLNEILSYIDFTSPILTKITHLPTLILLYIINSQTNRMSSKFELTISEDYSYEIKDYGVIDIKCKKTSKFLYSIDLESCPELGSIVYGLDLNNILIMEYDFSVHFILLKKDKYRILEYKGSSYNYCVNNRYYFSTDLDNAYVYDLDINRTYVSRMRTHIGKELQSKIEKLITN